MTSETSPPTAETNGRDGTGRFAAGNRFASGRVSRRDREKKYLAAFCEAVTPSELTLVARALLEKAKGGSVAAARLLLAYSLGQPTMRVEFDPEEAEYRVAGVSPAEHMTEMMALIQAKVQEQREYEAELAAKGVDVGRNTVSESKDG